MKKIMIIQHYGGVGGSGIGLLTTINALKKKYQVVVYCPQAPLELAVYYKKLNIDTKIYDFDNPSLSYYNGGAPWYSRGFLKSVLNIRRALQEWEKIITQERPDAVIVNSMVMSWLGQLHLPYCRLICHVRETLPRRNTLLGRWMIHHLNQFQGVMFISEYDKKLMNLTKPLQSIIRDSLIDAVQKSIVNTDDIQKENVHHILFMGGADRIKGLNVAIKAILLTDDSYVLDIAGYLPAFLLKQEQPLPRENFILKKYHSELKTLIQNGYEKNRINIIGHVDDVSVLYEQCDVVIFPSIKAHQSRPAIEAGLYKKPVIISDFPNTKESIINEYNGLTFRPGDANDLADKIMKLCRDSEKCCRLGNNNYDNTMKKHQEADVMEGVLCFINEVVN